MYLDYVYELIIKASSMRAVKTDPNIEGFDAVGAGTGHKLTPSVMEAARNGKGWKLEFVEDDESKQKEHAELNEMGNKEVFVYKKQDGSFAMTQDESIAEDLDSDYQSMTLRDVWAGKYTTIDDEGDSTVEDFDPHNIVEEIRNSSGAVESNKKHAHIEYLRKLGGAKYANALSKKSALVVKPGGRGFNLKEQADSPVSPLGLLHLAELTHNSELKDAIMSYTNGSAKSSPDFGGSSLRILPSLDPSESRDFNSYMNTERTQAFIEKVSTCKTRNGVTRAIHDVYRDYYKQKSNKAETQSTIPIPTQTIAPPVVNTVEAVQEAIADLQHSDVAHNPDYLKEIKPSASRLATYSKQEFFEGFNSVSEGWSDVIQNQTRTAFTSAIASVMPTASSEEKEKFMSAFATVPAPPPGITRNKNKLKEHYASVPEPIRSEFIERRVAAANYASMDRSLTLEYTPASRPQGSPKESFNANEGYLMHVMAHKLTNLADTSDNAQARLQRDNVQGVDFIVKGGLSADLIGGTCLYAPGETDNYINLGYITGLAKNLPITINKTGNAITSVDIDTGVFKGSITMDSTPKERRDAISALNNLVRRSGVNPSEALLNNVRGTLSSQGKDASHFSYSSSSFYDSHTEYMNSVSDSVAHSAKDIFDGMFAGIAGGSSTLEGGTKIKGDYLKQREVAGAIVSNLDRMLNESGEGGLDSLVEALAGRISGGNNYHREPEVVQGVMKPIIGSILRNIRDSLAKQITNEPSEQANNISMKQFGDFLEPISNLPSVMAIISEHGLKNVKIESASGWNPANARGLDGMDMDTPISGTNGDYSNILVRVKTKDGVDFHHLGKQAHSGSDSKANTGGSTDLMHYHIQFSGEPTARRMRIVQMGQEVKWGKNRDDDANFNDVSGLVNNTMRLGDFADEVVIAPTLKSNNDYISGKNKKLRSIKLKIPDSHVEGKSSSASLNQLLKGGFSSSSGCFAFREAPRVSNGDYA